MMNRDAGRALPEQNGGETTPRESLGKRMLGGLIHNWGWKILSLVLAVCLWGVLISQDNALPRDKVIPDVRISVTNAAVLRSNGLIVVSGLEDLETVSIRARVPQRNYPSASASNYTARLDLGQIQEPGIQTLSLTAAATNASQYGTVLEVLAPEVTLEVEEYVTQRRVPVEVRQEGEPPEGCYPGEIQRTADYVDISGPKSVVEAAVRCVVVYDRSGLNPNNSPNAVNLPFVFEDSQGNSLDSGKLTVTVSGQSATIQRIGITQEVYHMAQVPVDASQALVGQPAEGYAVSSVRIVPESVTLAGSESAVAPYRTEEAAIYPVEQISLSGAAQTVTGYVGLSVPENMDFISANSALIIVTILPQSFVNSAAEGGTENTP